MVALVDAHRAEYGVEPICAELPIAPGQSFIHMAYGRRRGRWPDRLHRRQGSLPAAALMTSSHFSTTDWNWTKLTSRVLSKGDEGMKKSRYTEEQIAFALRQAEGGTPVADVCRQMGVSEASFYVWKKKYGKLGITEIRELRQLRDENARLKRLVADLTLDKHILGEVFAKEL
jgi:putative transposase